jgi:MFS family permease
MELAYSVGLTIGPLFASLLFYINGYSFPFYVCSIILFICLGIAHSYLEINSEEFEVPPFIQTLFNPVS